jgi:hypothetical protein
MPQHDLGTRPVYHRKRDSIEAHLITSAALAVIRFIEGAPWCEDLVMAYHLTFFCQSGEKNGSTALATFLRKLTETGDPALIKRPTAEYADEASACELATDNGSAMPASGWSSCDWPLVNRIWAALIALWSAIAWDEMSGFEANRDAPGPA